MALLLKERGFSQVRPLLGGLDGWAQLAYPVETVAEAASPIAEEIRPPQPSRVLSAGEALTKRESGEAPGKRTELQRLVDR